MMPPFLNLGMTAFFTFTCFTRLRTSVALLALCSAPVQAENLQDIYTLALENDAVLLSAIAEAGAGRTLNQQALAELLPDISASYSRTLSDTNSTTESLFSPNPFLLENDVDEESYSVSLTQNILNAQAFFGYRQVKAISAQSALNLTLEQQNLILRVNEAYFDVLRGQDNLDSSRAEEKAIAQQLEQTQQRYEVGLIAITDVHEAQAAFDLAVANRLTEEVQLGIAYESLSVITGNQHRSLDTLAANFPVSKPQPENMDIWVEYATENSIAIQLAEKSLAAANENARVKTSAFLPTVQAIASYNKSDSTTESYDRINQTSLNDQISELEGSTIQLNVSLPIFSGGARYAERKQAGFERVAEQANLVAAKRQALQNTRSSYLTTLTDTARVNARSRAIISAESALEATQAGYEAGTRNIVDLLNAQRDLYRAKRDYANTRYDYIINSLRLKLAAGILSPKDIEDINRWLEPNQGHLKSEQLTTPTYKQPS